jgi:septum formation protein
LTPVILASASRSRGALLRAAGVEFTVRGSGVDEEPVKAAMLTAGARPREVAEKLAELKASAIADAGPALVIGADQTLELDGILFDKTRSEAETRERLQALRGRAHQLHTAVAVAQGGRIVWRACVSPRLVMRAFSDAFLEAYLARHGPSLRASVGAYYLEDEGAQLFEAIEGDYFAVLGLPLLDLLAVLREAGAIAS